MFDVIEWYLELEEMLFVAGIDFTVILYYSRCDRVYTRTSENGQQKGVSFLSKFLSLTKKGVMYRSFLTTEWPSAIRFW